MAVHWRISRQGGGTGPAIDNVMETVIEKSEISTSSVGAKRVWVGIDVTVKSPGVGSLFDDGAEGEAKREGRVTAGDLGEPGSKMGRCGDRVYMCLSPETHSPLSHASKVKHARLAVWRWGCGLHGTIRWSSEGGC